VADLRSFSKKVRLQGQAVVDNSTKLLRRVAVAVDRSVVLATPVDTGRARSNWQVELGAPAVGVLPAFDPGKSQSTASANTQRALDAARARIAQARNGDEIHLTNNLPYIGKLNDGWSAQAPSNFVEQAVQVGVDEIKGASILVTRSGDGA
jgi:hypothetical protein